MSDNHIRFIPTDPTYVPDIIAQQKARELLAAFVPRADTVKLLLSEQVEFVDQGSNFERVRCPLCSTELEIEWWQSAMDESYKANFTHLGVVTPCCKRSTNLNDLRYEMPAGFARFRLDVLNPDVRNIGEDQLQVLQAVLNCTLRTIWAHY